MENKQDKSNNPLGLMNISETALALRIDRRKVLKLIESGELHGLRMLGRWVVEYSALQAYLKKLRERYENEYVKS